MRIGKFRQDQRGAAAIEFALVLPLLIGLMAGTVEIGLVGIVSNNLDNAVQGAARKLRTGEADGATSASDFANQVCAGMFDSQASCLSKLAISVQKFGDFASAEAVANNAPAGQFDKGDAGDIVLVKATYQWPFFMPFFNLGFQQSGLTTIVLDARTTFKNEPFS